MSIKILGMVKFDEGIPYFRQNTAQPSICFVAFLLAVKIGRELSVEALKAKYFMF